ncbi:response regulator transcription factor [Deminuibacter soli]|uniref:DNA-binding response regulator n=1 Tax=Deminuibacter soli TaxID=2291815 RepID=A0A3E1NLN8_9BACT|nr:response regulator [Deminuibacter soli]RFM28845.1 DNA-binding response regulator [Deminuibacter soli]
MNEVPAKNILIVEDDDIMLKVVERILKREGYGVEIARDGKEALQKVQDNKYALIITDLMMPYANGFEIISKVNGNAEKRTPVIILSSLGNEDSIMEGFKMGADDFLRKPVMVGELVIRVKRLIDQNK